MAGADSVEKLEDVIVRSAEQVAGQIRATKDAISTVIFGQERVIDNTLVTILSGGHALLIGVPGLAKTKLVETLGITLGLDAKRIQFTPDLMPSDILGAEVLDESSSGKRSFRFISGPVFAQLLMADEINRASPSLMLAVRARALLDGRRAPSIDDVLDLAEPVLKHRMALTFSARAEGRTIPDVIRQLKTRIG